MIIPDATVEESLEELISLSGLFNISSAISNVVSISSLATILFSSDKLSPIISSAPAKIPANADSPVTINGADTITSQFKIPEVINAFANISFVTKLTFLEETLIPPWSVNFT